MAALNGIHKQLAWIKKKKKYKIIRQVRAIKSRGKVVAIKIEILTSSFSSINDENKKFRSIKKYLK